MRKVLNKIMYCVRVLFHREFNKKELEARKRVVAQFIDNWNNFIFYIDTREKNPQVYNDLAKNGLNVKRGKNSRKIEIGDIGIDVWLLNLNEEDIKMAYELKDDLSEVIGNITEEMDEQTGFNRFDRELQKSIFEGYHFKYVCRHGCYMDVIQGTIQYGNGEISKFNPKSLIGKLKSYESLYNVILQFMTPSEAVYDIAISFKYRVYNYLVYYGTPEHYRIMKEHNINVRKMKRKAK